ncbi:hypothetical protein PtA15_5A522 [Puccinia triticina]|uniref:PXA domain-containing protein n=2 Tax=Puccinia triticina TaxID=208348 RepID=A0ABY7CIK3_9BASI|nr:uncharacterized protein PtA15_5A522 [Puccinia triticina]WAQ84949.1 hypothetical protein PtA15_5A522 [Puccinia triticina]
MELRHRSSALLLRDEWDATHNAWYFVDTRQSAPVPTWTDPRHSAPAGAGDRGLMGSLGSMLSGKPAGQAPMGSHPAPPHGAYNNTAPGYPGAYTPQAPPMHHYNGGPGEASAYYNQPAPPAPYSSSAPPNAAKPAGGLGGLLAKIPGGGGGGGGSGGGGAGAMLAKLPGMLGGSGSGSGGGGGGGKKTNPLLAGAGGAAAAAIAGKLLGGGHKHGGGGHHGGGLMSLTHPDRARRFQQLHPHPAIALAPPPLLVSPTYLRLLISAALHALLPPADFHADAERILLRELLLNALLRPLFDTLSQPARLHRLLLRCLPPTQPPPQPPQHSPRRALPALLAALIRIHTHPPPIPVPDSPILFDPLLDLLYTILGRPPHLVQLFWLARIVCRLFHRLLAKIAAQVIYDALLSPAAVERGLEALLALLRSLDQPTPEPPAARAQAKEEEADEATSAAALEDALLARLASPLLAALLLPPAALHADPAARDARKRTFIRATLLPTLDCPPANAALLLQLIDLALASILPQLLIHNTPPP